MFGTTQYFVFCNPKERDAAKTPFPEVTFEMAQEEIAKRSGFDVNMENKSRGEEEINIKKIETEGNMISVGGISVTVTLAKSCEN